MKYISPKEIYKKYLLSFEHLVTKDKNIEMEFSSFSYIFQSKEYIEKYFVNPELLTYTEKKELYQIYGYGGDYGVNIIRERMLIPVFQYETIVVGVKNILKDNKGKSLLEIGEFPQSRIDDESLLMKLEYEYQNNKDKFKVETIYEDFCYKKGIIKDINFTNKTNIDPDQPIFFSIVLSGKKYMRVDIPNKIKEALGYFDNSYKELVGEWFLFEPLNFKMMDNYNALISQKCLIILIEGSRYFYDDYKSNRREYYPVEWEWLDDYGVFLINLAKKGLLRYEYNEEYKKLRAENVKDIFERKTNLNKLEEEIRENKLKVIELNDKNENLSEKIKEELEKKENEFNSNLANKKTLKKEEEKNVNELEKEIANKNQEYEKNENSNNHIKEALEKTKNKVFNDRIRSLEEIQIKLEKIKEITAKKLNADMLGYDFNSSSDFFYERNSPEKLIKAMILSDVSVFLHGPSSEGKSSRVKQFDPNCTIIYLRNATPESLNGKTGYDQNARKSIDIPPPWYDKVVKNCENEPNKIHILFFDEFTNALPAIQGFAFNIILDKEIDGKWILPKNCRIVAAGNEVEDSLSAHEMVEPVYNRFAHVNVETTVENWVIWAMTEESSYEKLDYYEIDFNILKIHPMIYNFINKYGDLVLRTKFTGKEPNADPRRWELASKILYTTNNPYDLKPMIGDELTNKFSNYCKNYNNYNNSNYRTDYNNSELDLYDILSGKNDYKLANMNISEKNNVINILSEANEDLLEKAIEKVKILGNEYYKIFKYNWIKDDYDRERFFVNLEKNKVKKKVK